MSHRLKKHAKTLKFLSECDRHTSNSIIKTAKPDLLCCIADICYNILRGKVKLSPIAKKRLAKYKKHIRKIADKKTTANTRRSLIQKGGFLGSILAPLIGTILKPLAQGILQ
jgi:hypothetical protein